jgi:hypothetical protein
MYYKEDWPQARRRIEAFWRREILDRCCVAVFAPRKTSNLPPFPELQWGPWLGGLDEIPDSDHAAITRWWTDPEQNYRRLITWFENTYFGGEAIPATYVDWGAMALAACFGSPARFTKTTVWYDAVIEDLDAWQWQFDPETNPFWQKILEIQRCLIDRNRGRYFLGKPGLGNAADVLSLMRGMDRLALDLIDNIEWTPGAGAPPTFSPQHIPPLSADPASRQTSLSAGRAARDRPAAGGAVSARALPMHARRHGRGRQRPSEAGRREASSRTLARRRLRDDLPIDNPPTAPYTVSTSPGQRSQ